MSRYGPPAYEQDRSGEILGTALANAIGSIVTNRRQRREDERRSKLDLQGQQEHETRMATMGAFPEGTERTDTPIDPFTAVSGQDLHDELARMPLRTTPTAPAQAAPPSPQGVGNALANMDPGEHGDYGAPASGAPAKTTAATHPGAFDPGTRQFGGSPLQIASAIENNRRAAGGATTQSRYRLPSGVEYDPQVSARALAADESASNRVMQMQLAEALRLNDIHARGTEARTTAAAETPLTYRPNADGTYTALPSRVSSGADLAHAIAGTDTGVRTPPRPAPAPRVTTGAVGGETYRGTVGRDGTFNPLTTPGGEKVHAPPPRSPRAASDMPLVHQISTLKAQLTQADRELTAARKAAADPALEGEKKTAADTRVRLATQRRDSISGVYDQKAALQQSGGSTAPPTASASPVLDPANERGQAMQREFNDAATRYQRLVALGDSALKAHGHTRASVKAAYDETVRQIAARYRATPPE